MNKVANLNFNSINNDNNIDIDNIMRLTDNFIVRYLSSGSSSSVLVNSTRHLINVTACFFIFSRSIVTPFNCKKY